MRFARDAEDAAGRFVHVEEAQGRRVDHVDRIGRGVHRRAQQLQLLDVPRVPCSTGLRQLFQASLHAPMLGPAGDPGHRSVPDFA